MAGTTECKSIQKSSFVSTIGVRAPIIRIDGTTSISDVAVSFMNSSVHVAVQFVLLAIGALYTLEYRRNLNMDWVDLLFIFLFSVSFECFRVASDVGMCTRKAMFLRLFVISRSLLFIVYVNVMARMSRIERDMDPGWSSLGSFVKITSAVLIVAMGCDCIVFYYGLLYNGFHGLPVNSPEVNRGTYIGILSGGCLYFGLLIAMRPIFDSTASYMVHGALPILFVTHVSISTVVCSMDDRLLLLSDVELILVQLIFVLIEIFCVLASVLGIGAAMYYFGLSELYLNEPEDTYKIVFYSFGTLLSGIGNIVSVTICWMMHDILYKQRHGDDIWMID